MGRDADEGGHGAGAGGRPQEPQDYGQLLENLARLVPGVIYQYRLDPDGHSAFPWSSPGMSLIYEVTPEQVREDATPVFGRLHPDDYDRVAEAIFESARTLQTFYCEFRVVLPRQGLRWRWSQAQPERTADGGTLWHGIIIDVTDRKLAEEQNLKLQAQLQQTTKMEAVGRLAGGVAHDFNNLLTAILGNVALALSEPDSVELVTESLTEIGKAASSAAALTRQLLAFSRKQVIEPRVLDANELICSLRRMLGRLLGADIELRLTLAESLGTVRIDPSQLEQLLVNLAVNARDAMPGGGTLTIATAETELGEVERARHPDAAPGRYVTLEVRDTGHGFDDRVKAHLFEPFFTTKEEGKGTGLGLSMVFGAVKAAGGFIDVSSGVGAGTTFRIHLPSLGNTPVAREPEAVSAGVRGGSETILLVEDQEVVRRLSSKVLRRLGYDVLEAPDGPTALALSREVSGPIHLLLTDVVMPGMSGPELAQRLEALRPGIPVLFASGYSENAISQQGILNRGVNFIAKPYVPAALGHKVRAVLGAARRASAASR